MRRFLIALVLLCGALQWSACSGGEKNLDGVASSASAVASRVDLETYSDDFINGPGRGCAGLEVAALRISIPPDGQPTGTTEPRNPARSPWKLVWPEGFTLLNGQDGPEIAGPGGITIRNGDALQNVDVCTGIDTLYVVRFASITSP